MISVTQWTPENSLENTIKSIEKPRRTVSATLISLFFIFPHSAIAVPNTTTANNVTQEFNKDLTFTVFDPTTLTVDNGHITQLLTKTVTVKDSNVKEVRVGASTKSVTNGTGVTVKTTVTTGAGSAEISKEANLALTSTSLEIAKVGSADSTGEVSINLVWGTFGTAA